MLVHIINKLELQKKRVHCHTTLSLSAVCAPITRKVLAHS